MIALFWPRPTHSGKAINQGTTRNAKRTADRCLTGTAFEGRKHGLQFFAIQGAWPTAMPSSAFSRANTGLDPFLDECPLVLGERPKEVEQQLAMRRIRIGNSTASTEVSHLFSPLITPTGASEVAAANAVFMALDSTVFRWRD